MLHYRETTQESFEAWGTGFRYNYACNKHSLNVFHRHTERHLVKLRLDQFSPEQALSYVCLLEKACQINALIVSNNDTINLADTMELRHVTPLIQSVGEISRHAFNLQNHYLKCFGEAFAKEFNLKSVKIKLFEPQDSNTKFFIARIQTHHENGICVRSCNLPGLMAAMADRTAKDLMTEEFGHRFEGSAHNLLNASVKLSSLSLILDKDFIPEHNINHHENEKMTSQYA